MSKKLNKNSEIIDPKWDASLNESQKRAFHTGVQVLLKDSNDEDFKESDPKGDRLFQEAMDLLFNDSTPKEEIRTFGGGSSKFKEALDAIESLPTAGSEYENYEASVNKVTDAIEEDVFQELMEKPVSEERLQKESQHPSLLDGGDYEALVDKLADIIGNEVEKNKLDLGILLGDVVVISTKRWLGEGYYEDGGGLCTKLWRKYDMLSGYTQVHLVNMKHHVDYFFEELKNYWWPKKESDKNKK